MHSSIRARLSHTRARIHAWTDVWANGAAVRVGWHSVHVRVNVVLRVQRDLVVVGVEVFARALAVVPRVLEAPRQAFDLPVSIISAQIAALVSALASGTVPSM